MLYFDCDYMEGAHPAILQRMMETNMEHTYGYGKDAYCESAKAKIRTACQCVARFFCILQNQISFFRDTPPRLCRPLWEGLLKEPTSTELWPAASAGAGKSHSVRFVLFPQAASNHGQLIRKAFYDFVSCLAPPQPLELFDYGPVRFVRAPAVRDGEAAPAALNEVRSDLVRPA